VHQLAANLARILGVTRERMRCVTGDVGGGFGSKIQPYPEYVALAWAARRVGRPVKWVSSRSEGFVTDAPVVARAVVEPSEPYCSSPM
jgi:carbon-monoxide dehydrogenase large subunit